MCICYDYITHDQKLASGHLCKQPNIKQERQTQGTAVSKYVSPCQSFFHIAAEEGLASPHNILGWEKNMLWFIAISLKQSQSP